MLQYYYCVCSQWQEAAESESLEDKQHVCERVFEGGEEEYGLLEVLKLLMLAKAVELFAKMQKGHDVPVFCWLLFARDTSENPRMFFTNHLSQVGFSGGVEQVQCSCYYSIYCVWYLGLFAGLFKGFSL